MSEAPRQQHTSPNGQPATSTLSMTENKTPGDAPNASTATADQPGRPYYEQLRTTLRGTLEKKRKLDEQLAALEEQIFKVEGAYLEETSNSGNIVRGFDGWVKGVSVGGRGADDRRRGRVRDEDRVFSRSSVGWMRVRFAHFENICAVSLLTILNRRKKARIRTPRRMRRRLPALSTHPYLAQRVPQAPPERPGIRRSEPPKKTTMTRRRPSAGKSLMRGTERNGHLLQKRSEHGVRRREYQDLVTVDFWVIEGTARQMDSIRPCVSTSKPAPDLLCTEYLGFAEPPLHATRQTQVFNTTYSKVTRIATSKQPTTWIRRGRMNNK